ncbi:MAG TPA: hypothetical protein DCY50_02265 [Franconibacter helveticus]|nr:hypothetical protein [Franconibacter helveticus]
MTPQEFFAFLLPRMEIIQLVFGGLMLLMVVATIGLLCTRANPTEWEKNWRAGTPDNAADDPDVENGSVNEMSAAVATDGEKMADVMPGVLLIVGLLGTFLGLGIALNKASDILIDANSAGMDSAMTNLMGMMEGLETEFKTATWGIIAFRVLKTWAAFGKYDEKRLRWCAQKMKAVVGQKRQAAHLKQAHTEERFIQTLETIDASIRLQGEATQSALLTLQSGIEPLLKTLTAQGVDTLQASHAHGERLAQLGETLAGLRHDAAGQMQAQAENQDKQLAQAIATRESLQRFIAANSENLAAIQHSAQQMADAAQGMGDSAKDLQSAIGDFRTGVTEVLATLKTDLGSTINQMGDSFSQNMASISANMANATDGISHAVTDLSQSVGVTMNEVRGSIERSMDLQSKTQRDFIVTSDTLNEKVIAMTRLVDDLREQIVSGLRAVSESGRRVASLNTRYEALTDAGVKSADAIAALVEALSAMQQRSPLQPAMDKIDAGIGQLVRSVEKAHNDALSGSEASSALASLDNRLTDTLTTLTAIQRDMAAANQTSGAQLAQTLKPLSATLQSLERKLSTPQTLNPAALGVVS